MGAVWHDSPATYYDGLTARAQMAVVQAGPDGLVVTPAGQARQVWPLARLRQADGAAQGGNFVLALAPAVAGAGPRSEARLVLHDAGLIAWVRQNAPDLPRDDAPRGSGLRLLWRAAAAVGAVLGLLFLILPRLSDQLALSLPPAREAAFGRVIVSQMTQVFGDKGPARQCNSTPGRAALDRVVARLAAVDPDGAPDAVVVLDSAVVNAFAVPGRQIAVLRGLIADAKSPEELAGVLSHEMGHIAARDPIRLAFRTAGSAGLVSLIIGDVTGGTLMALMADQLLQAGYTREAEAAADLHAYALLGQAGISARGLADFFDRLAAAGDDVPAYLSTHPQLAQRAADARRAALPTTTPVITDAEWAALRQICD